MEFYVGQCSEYVKNDSQLQEEISLSQTSIKKSTVENSATIENLQNSVKNLENSVVFYKEVMIDENEKLKNEVGILKAHIGRGLVNEDLFTKYNLKCSMVEELLSRDGRADRARARLKPILLSLTGSAQLQHF